MGRKTIEINLDMLRETIQAVEASGPLGNLSALYTQVSELLISRGEVNANPQLVMLRINKLGIPVKTQKGKRGRQPGHVVDLGTIPSRGRRKMSDPNYNALLASGPSGGKGQVSKQSYKSLLGKARTGSLKAVIRLKCLECADYQREEIRLCGCLSCPLYSIRPFKTSEEKVKTNR